MYLQQGKMLPAARYPVACSTFRLVICLFVAEFWPYFSKSSFWWWYLAKLASWQHWLPGNVVLFTRLNATKSDISIVFYVVFYVFWLTRWLVEIDLVLGKMQNVVFNPNFVWWLCRRVPTFRERVAKMCKLASHLSQFWKSSALVKYPYEFF